MPTQPSSGRKPKSPPAFVPKQAAKAKKAVRPAGPAVKSSHLERIRAEVGVSIRLLSRLTGFSERAIAGWESGAPVSEPAKRRLLEIERFRARLAEVVKPESIPAWLDTPQGCVIHLIFGVVVLTTLLHVARAVVSVHARTAKTLLVLEGR